MTEKLAIFKFLDENPTVLENKPCISSISYLFPEIYILIVNMHNLDLYCIFSIK